MRPQKSLRFMRSARRRDELPRLHLDPRSSRGRDDISYQRPSHGIVGIATRALGEGRFGSFATTFSLPTDGSHRNPTQKILVRSRGKRRVVRRPNAYFFCCRRARLVVDQVKEHLVNPCDTGCQVTGRDLFDPYAQRCTGVRHNREATVTWALRYLRPPTSSMWRKDQPGPRRPESRRPAATRRRR